MTSSKINDSNHIAFVKAKQIGENKMSVLELKNFNANSIKNKIIDLLPYRNPSTNKIEGVKFLLPRVISEKDKNDFDLLSFEVTYMEKRKYKNNGTLCVTSPKFIANVVKYLLNSNFYICIDDDYLITCSYNKEQPKEVIATMEYLQKMCSVEKNADEYAKLFLSAINNIKNDNENILLEKEKNQQLSIESLNKLKPVKPGKDEEFHAYVIEK